MMLRGVSEPTPEPETGRCRLTPNRPFRENPVPRLEFFTWHPHSRSRFVTRRKRNESKLGVWKGFVEKGKRDTPKMYPCRIFWWREYVKGQVLWKVFTCRRIRSLGFFCYSVIGEQDSRIRSCWLLCSSAKIEVKKRPFK